MLEIRIRRQAAVSVKDQIRAQIELLILSGGLKSGSRLPSVRVLARRLETHPNTVSLAYRDLERSGHVALKSGSGVFVRPRPATTHVSNPAAARLGVAIREALALGLTPDHIQREVQRCLNEGPADGILIVDPSIEMAEIYASEVRHALGTDVQTMPLGEFEAAAAGVPRGRILAVLPYHVARVEPLVSRDRLVILTLSVPDLSDIDPGGTGAGLVTVVSSSPLLLSFARVYLGGSLGTDFHVETRLSPDASSWKRLLDASDLVFVDAISARLLPRGARNVRPLKLVSEDSLQRLREALRR